MATKTKNTAGNGEGKARTAPGIDDPWGRLDATRLAFVHKAETHPEHAPMYLEVAAVLSALRDRDFRREAVNAWKRRSGVSKGRHGIAKQDAQDFAELVKAALLADTLGEASRRVLRTLETSTLLWGRPGKLDQGPKRPRRLDLGAVEEALRDAYTDTAASDFRAAGALAMTAEHNPAEWQEAFVRFHDAIDGEALAKRALRAVEVEMGWPDDLYE